MGLILSQIDALFHMPALLLIYGFINIIMFSLLKTKWTKWEDAAKTPSKSC